tara:strand:+ start:470 stop:1084 length:615 start_codon:yes stop_codon:yes gene_type:complete
MKIAVKEKTPAAAKMSMFYSEYDRDEGISDDSDDDPCPDPMNYSDPKRWRQIDAHREHLAEMAYLCQLPRFKPFRMEITDTYTVKDKTRDVTEYFEEKCHHEKGKLKGAVVLFRHTNEVIEKAGCGHVPKMLEGLGAIVQRQFDEKINFIVYIEPNFTKSELPRVIALSRLNQVFEVEELFENSTLFFMKDNGGSIRQLGDKPT